MTIKKCDLCLQEKEVKTFPRAKLRTEKLVILTKFGVKNEKLVKTWIHQKLEKLEQANIGFKRKSRICKECQKEVGL